MSKKNNATKLVDTYNLKEKNFNTNVPNLLQKYRAPAAMFLRKLGLPDKNNEDYRHCDINDLFNKEIATPVDIDLDFVTQNPLSYDFISKRGIDGLECISLVIINNRLNKQLSQGLDVLPKSLFIGTLSQFLEEYPQREAEVEHVYGRLAEPDIDGSIALNQLMTQELLLIDVKQNTQIDKPIILHQVMHTNKSIIATPRTMVLLGENSQTNLIILNHHLGDHNYIIDRVNEIIVNKQAKLNLFSLQRENKNVKLISTTILRLHEESHTICNEFVFSKGISRNNVRARFVGERAKLTLNGLAIGKGDAVIDNFTHVEHTKPECQTDELYKYLLEDNSIASFSGRIFISSVAQKTHAYQQNRNLLISPKAKVFSKPQLEIYADDVHCSHGMTTGQLDDEALFYMQQRGIPLQDARNMLSLAFAESVIERIDIPRFQEILREEVKNSLFN